MFGNRLGEFHILVSYIPNFADWYEKLLGVWLQMSFDTLILQSEPPRTGTACVSPVEAWARRTGRGFVLSCKVRCHDHSDELEDASRWKIIELPFSVQFFSAMKLDEICFLQEFIIACFCNCTRKMVGRKTMKRGFCVVSAACLWSQEIRIPRNPGDADRWGAEDEVQTHRIRVVCVKNI